MTLVLAQLLTAADVRSLGVNVLHDINREKRSLLAAVNRSLQTIDEQVDRLTRRTPTPVRKERRHEQR
jgi:hypothetical protein